MKFLKYLQEKYMGSFTPRYSKDYVEYFVNPTRKELVELSKKSMYGNVRFAADDKRKKVYVWSSSQATHQDALDEIYGSFSYPPHILTGIVSLKGGKWIVGSGDGPFLELYSDLRKLKSIDWSWVEKYFNIDEVYADLGQIR